MKSLWIFLLVLGSLGGSAQVNGALKCRDLFKDRQKDILTWAELDQLKSWRRPGFQFAKRGDAKVLVKPIRSPKEAEWFSYLASLGLGPRYHGSLEKDGITYVVMEFVEGFNTNDFSGVSLPPSFPHEAVLKEMKRQMQILLRNGILPVDLQFQVSTEGDRVVIVDPEAFIQISPFAGTASPVEREQRQAELVWRNFEMNYRTKFME